MREMKNDELLILENPFTCRDRYYKRRIRLSTCNDNGRKLKCFLIEYHKNVITGTGMRDIIHLLHYTVVKYSALKYPIMLDIGETSFNDKLVYIVLECVIHIVMEKYHRKVYICYKVTDSIWTEGFKYSCLNNVNDGFDIFEKKFKYDLDRKHFRKVFTYQDYCDKKCLSKLMTDIRCFLKNNCINESSVDELTEVLIELVGNSGEHAKTDCLIDLDLTDDTYKSTADDLDNYYGLNACVVNFSKELFYVPLMNKMKSSQEVNERHIWVKKAKNNHERYFSDKYSEKDFYTISSFQDKISGSIQKNKTGGRGLTSLISSLGEKASDQLCYMASGNRALFFYADHMRFNKEEFIGFNKNNDYINSIPEDGVIRDVDVYLPGTMYNLSYVIKKESIE
ncbi:Hypothetical protein EUBELI_20304 (plasmid) [Lachnospira eligens ATCC 27750]|uniref:Uncharacterized protein n=2 Tax=Lachnospira eligens TaxID=39485 RepID=C4Z657_LACE2|nr:Hypothetical protein EUBELI_20304 [[Eubacterium] eligens ATCC 27750]